MPPAAACPSSPTRHFLGWDGPLLGRVVDHLAGEWSGGVLDLRGLVVVVPTRQSGRRLREALAVKAAGRSAAVFPPRVLTPEAFFSEIRKPGLPVASTTMVRLAWINQLRALRPAEFPALFPQPIRQDFAWSAGLARAVTSVRSALGENGLDFAAVCDASGPHREEIDRWRDLARLERRYRETLGAAGLVDAEDAKREAALSPQWPGTAPRLVIAAVPDPPPMLIPAIDAVSQRAAVAVEILIAAPESLAAAFDQWGRPRTTEWLERVIALDADRLHVRRGAVEQAEAVVDLAGAHDHPSVSLGVGLLDAELAPFVRAASNQPLASGAGLEWFDPEGAAGSAHELFHLLGALARFLDEGSFSALAALLRLPAAATALQLSESGGRSTMAHGLALLDDYRVTHMPGSLSDALRRAPDPLRPVLEAARDLAAACERGPLSEVMATWLERGYSHREFAVATGAGRDFRDMAHAIMEGLEELEAAVTRCGLTLAPGDRLKCLLESIGTQALEADRPADAVDLQGWLELPWEPAPHLILVGCNDGRVPEHLQGDLFLPDAARSALGLRSNATREARDAFLLTTLVESRRPTGGCVDFVLGRVDATGDPMRPSRLLLRCAPPDLPARVEWLFGETALPPAPGAPAPSVAWKLRPPAAPALTSLSVTDFKSYLRCPLRFYLSRVLRMAAVEPDVTELDAAAFGTLCHAALRAFGQDENIRDSDNEDLIASYLQAEVGRQIHARFGPQPNVAVRVQAESAIRRLRAFARWQAQTRREGWQIAVAEQTLASLLDDRCLNIGNLALTGKIDRIDRCASQWRVIDYKTSDSPRNPAEAHLAPAGTLPADRRWQAVTVEGKSKRWIDLQLPLYALAMRTVHGARPEVGYFHLAKAAGDVIYAPWTTFSEELLESAHHCAEAVAAAVQSGDFHAREAHIEYDEFDPILLGDASKSVEWFKPAPNS